MHYHEERNFPKNSDLIQITQVSSLYGLTKIHSTSAGRVVA